MNISDLWWINILHKAVPMPTAFPDQPMIYVILKREWLGFVLVGLHLFVLPAVLRFTVFKRMYEQMGGLRYGVMIFLLLLMALMPIKMVLRWLFNLKYFIYLPEFSANL